MNTLSTLQTKFLNSISRDVSPATPGTLVMVYDSWIVLVKSEPYLGILSSQANSCDDIVLPSNKCISNLSPHFSPFSN